jgi:hypothetical protein
LSVANPLTDPTAARETIMTKSIKNFDPPRYLKSAGNREFRKKRSSETQVSIKQSSLNAR